METREFQLKVVFLEGVLGSQPSGQVASEFLAKKAGYEVLPMDELESLPEALEKGTTVFHRNGKEEPVLFDYQVKGFIKNAGKVLNGKVKGGIKNLRMKVNDYIFVSPRKIELHMPEGGTIEYLERPLRAETAQGPRVALARSEMLPAGTWFKCGLTVVGGVLEEEVVRELLDYGYWMGIGQWRNARYGCFRYELVREE